MTISVPILASIQYMKERVFLILFLIYAKNVQLALFPEVKKKLVTVVEKTVDDDGKEVERTTVTEDSH